MSASSSNSNRVGHIRWHIRLAIIVLSEGNNAPVGPQSQSMPISTRDCDDVGFSRNWVCRVSPSAPGKHLSGS